MLLYLWTSDIIVFIVRSKTIIAALLVMLITILIIDLEDNPSSSLPFSKIRDFLYGTRIPSSIMILAIHQVTFLQPHSPIEIARP
jgi:hypothetical protein